MATKYGHKAQDKVERAMHEMKHGELESGSGQKVTSRKQAIAIGLSEARKEGGKVPPSPSEGGSEKRGAKKGAKKTAAKKSSSRKTASKKTASRKTGAKKTAAKKSSSRKTASKKTAAKKRSR